MDERVQRATDFFPVEADLRELSRAVLHRKWIAIFSAALIFTAVAVYTLESARIYQTAALVMIERAAPRVLGGEVSDFYDLGSSSYWDDDYYQTQYKLIRGREVASRAAQRLGLSKPELKAAIAATPSAVNFSATLDLAVADQLELLEIPVSASKEEILAMIDEVDPVMVLQNKITVEPLEGSYLVGIAVADTKPARAQRLANVIAHAYVDTNLERKIAVTSGASDWLRGQLRALESKLEESEEALQRFKIENDMLSASLDDRISILSQSLMQLNARLIEVRADGMALQAKLAQIEQLDEDESLAELEQSEVFNELKKTISRLKQEKRALSQRRTEAHPSVVALSSRINQVRQDIAQERDRIIKALKASYAANERTRKSLTAEIAALRVKAHDVHGREILYQRLVRERDIHQNVYQLVLKRQQEADLTRMLEVNNVHIVESASLPVSPIRPRVLLNLAAGLALGLLAGLGIALAIVYLDNSLKSPEQIERMGLYILGILPLIKGEKADDEPGGSLSGRDLFVLENPRSAPAESCRNIRTNLLFMSPDNPLTTIMITSPGPREGKSLMTVNLAATMAQLGSRTLVVDTDLRRPRLHRTFGLEGEKGLSSVLVGEITLANAVKKTQQERLTVLPCGPIPPNPSELLHTQAFLSLLDELRHDYDRILCDSPPVNVVTDAVVLSSLVDGVILVARSAMTTTSTIQHASRRLQGIGGNLLGVVVNGVIPSSGRYGYGAYEGYYRSGYY